MTPEEFESHVHQECLRILRSLVSKRYDSAGQRAAALALLAEEQSQHRYSHNEAMDQDPYDLKLLDVYDCGEDHLD